jgi:hypothetical protein
VRDGDTYQAAHTAIHAGVKAVGLNWTTSLMTTIRSFQMKMRKIGKLPIRVSAKNVPISSISNTNFLFRGETMKAKDAYKLAYRLCRIESRLFEIQGQLEDSYEIGSIAPLMIKGGRYGKECLRLRRLLHGMHPVRDNAKRTWNMAEAFPYISALDRALALHSYHMTTIQARLYQPGLWPKVLDEYRRSLADRPLFRTMDRMTRFSYSE